MTILGLPPNHGIVFRTQKKGRRLTVSCQCRASETKHSRTKGGGEVYEPFEVPPNQTVWQAYNNPENHWIEFTDSDRIRI